MKVCFLGYPKNHTLVMIFRISKKKHPHHLSSVVFVGYPKKLTLVMIFRIS